VIYCTDFNKAFYFQNVFGFYGTRLNVILFALMGESRPPLLQFYENSKYPEESYPDLCTDFTPNGIINVEYMGRDLFTFYVKYCFHRADFCKSACHAIYCVRFVN
jgi:hypothetical protein